MNRLTDADYNNLKKIIANHECVNGARNSGKILLYSFFISLWNKYKASEFETGFVINGRAEMRYVKQEKAVPVFYGLFSRKISDYHSALTHVTSISKIVRFQRIFQGLFCNSHGCPRGYIVDYLLWKEFFQLYPVQTIGGSGHYDRLTTQIALLASDFNKQYQMRQHGLLAHQTKLKYKIPVFSVVAYDSYEAQKFREEVVLNQDCIYMVEYHSTVDFFCSDNKEFRVGVIDTPIEEMPEIIHTLPDARDDVEYIVMQHPLSHLMPDEFRSPKTSFTISAKKDMNYICLIAGPSTLVYDYVQRGYARPIFVYLPPKNAGLKDVFDRFPNVSTYEKVDKLQDALSAYLNESKK